MPAIHAGEPEASRARSENELFQVSWESQPAPVPMLELHRWTITVVDRDGAPVDGARITVMGGMPAHGHGLPTTPVVRPLGDGRYLIDGLRFNMPGRWVVGFRIRTKAAIDTVTFPLELP